MRDDIHDPGPFESHRLPLLREAETEPPRFLIPLPANRPQSVPSISVPEIDFSAWKSWRDVGRAVRQMPTLVFGQAWREADEADLLPAAVALAHHQGRLVVYAELSDADIFNPVREHGAHAYAHGDVFEIFLRADGTESYFEHHITPDNFTFQLSFPTLTAFAENCSADPDWAKPFATTLPIPSQILVQPHLQTWRILALFPLHLIAPNPRGPLPARWRFSFCRYDHTLGREKPVLSSTSPYRFANFHHHEMWGHLFLG